MNSPIFPLNTVLFPGGRIQLQIFEPRYLDMVKNCLKQDTGFTICLIREGKEVGEPAEFFEIGTHGKIVDWVSLENGLLGITVEGHSRVRIVDSQLQADNLLVGEQEMFHEEPDMPHPPELIQLLEQLEQHPFVKQLGSGSDVKQNKDVVWALCQILPIKNRIKQQLLEIQDSALRLATLRQVLAELAG